MSARQGVIAGCALVLALSACSRSAPIPAPDRLAGVASADASQPVVLAGGPPPSSSPEQDQAPAAAQASATATDFVGPPPVPPDSAPASDAAAVAAAAGTVADPAPVAAGDPLEPLNRQLYSVDTSLMRAVAARPRFMSAQEPHARAVAHAAFNLLNNLGEPDVAANDILQHKFGRAAQAAIRFVINSTVGVGGIADVAGHMGIRRRDNDLDHTLASFGAPAGPYLYLPIAGPMSLRAVIGAAAEGYLYPPHWLRLAAGVGAALRGANYAKLAQVVVARSQSMPDPASRDGYIKARRAYLEARTEEAPPLRRSTEVASAGASRD